MPNVDRLVALLRKDGLAGSLGGSKSATNAVLGRDAKGAVGGVEVLDDDKLEAGGAALARRDGRPGQEQLPDAVPALAVLGLDGVAVAEPVAVPAPKRTGVVDTDGVDAITGVSI